MTLPMIDNARKRLLYRSNYRGFKEADILLGGFVKANIETLSNEEVVQLEDLFTAKDHDIYDWITGKKDVPANFDTPLLARLKTYRPSQ